MKTFLLIIKSIIVIVSAAACVLLAGQYKLEVGLVAFALCILNFILGKIFNR
jgi:hypothetical protein